MADDPVFIPSSVRAAITIRNAAEDPCINDVAIQRMVAAEPTVAAALLRLANSATYRRGKLVESVADAVMLLGMGEVAIFKKLAPGRTLPLLALFCRGISAEFLSS